MTRRTPYSATADRRQRPSPITPRQLRHFLEWAIPNSCCGRLVFSHRAPSTGMTRGTASCGHHRRAYGRTQPVANEASSSNEAPVRGQSLRHTGQRETSRLAGHPQQRARSADLFRRRPRKKKGGPVEGCAFHGKLNASGNAEPANGHVQSSGSLHLSAPGPRQTTERTRPRLRHIRLVDEHRLSPRAPLPADDPGADVPDRVPRRVDVQAILSKPSMHLPARQEHRGRDDPAIALVEPILERDEGGEIGQLPGAGDERPNGIR